MLSGIYVFKKWYHLESNQGHMDFQSIALPTELWHQLIFETAKLNIFLSQQNTERNFLKKT